MNRSKKPCLRTKPWLGSFELKSIGPPPRLPLTLMFCWGGRSAPELGLDWPVTGPHSLHHVSQN